MSNVDTTTTASKQVQIYDMRTSISPGDLGNIPEIIKTIPEGSKEPRVLGIVIGKTNAISFRNNPNGDMPSVGLKGVFEFVANPEVSPGMINLRTALLYLPSNVQQIFVAAAMKEGQVIPTKVERGKSIDAEGNEVEIRIQMAVRRHPSPIGYQYLAMMMQDLAKTDPLANMRNETMALFGKQPLQITSQRLPVDAKAAAEAAGDQKPVGAAPKAAANKRK